MSASPAPVPAFLVAHLSIAARRLLALTEIESFDGIETGRALSRFDEAVLAIRNTVRSRIRGSIGEAIALHQQAIMALNRGAPAGIVSVDALYATQALEHGEESSRLLCEAGAAARKALPHAGKADEPSERRQALYWHNFAIERLEAEMRSRAREAA